MSLRRPACLLRNPQSACIVRALLAVIALAAVPACSSGPAGFANDELATLDRLEAVRFNAWKTGHADAVRDHVRSALDHPTARVREAAVRQLARTRSPGDIDALLDHLQREEDTAVRGAVLDVIGLHASPRVSRVLREAARDSESLRRAAAVRALGADAAIDAPILRSALVDPQAEVRLAAALAFARFPDVDDEGTLLARLAVEEDERVRWVAARAAALRFDGDGEIAEVWSRWLTDPNWIVARQAARAIGDSGQGAALDALLEALADRDGFWLRRLTAVQAIRARLATQPGAASERDGRRLARALIAASRESGSLPAALRAEVWSALASLSTAEAVEQLHEGMGSSSEEVRAAIFDGVSRTSDPVFLDRLLATEAEGLTQPVRRARARAIARLRPQRVDDLLESEHPGEALAAFRAIDSPSGALIDRALASGDPDLIELALARAAERDGALPLSLLAEQLEKHRKDGRWRLRLRALEWVDSRQSIVPYSALEPEYSRLAREDDSLAVRLAARRLLERGVDGLVERAVAPLATARLSTSYAFRDPARSLGRRLPRLALESEGGAEIFIELFRDDAPHHVSALLDLAERGLLRGARVERLGVPLGLSIEARPVAGDPLLGRQLPVESSWRRILRGTLIVLPARDGAGRFFIAGEPLPELEGRVTVLGRVALDVRDLEQIRDASAVHLSPLRGNIALAESPEEADAGT